MLPVGAAASVRSPATSANLGPGFDSLGLALDLWDEYTVTVVDRSGVQVASQGEGCDGLPVDENHLVARSLLAGLAHAGVTAPGFELLCCNAVPHGRGLGSSSAAIVGGLALARALAPEGALGDEAMVALATSLEGHPDNVAAAVLGGATIAWMADGVGHAVRTATSLTVPITVLVPEYQSATEAARGLLPAEVPHADAAFNVARAALLVHALQHEPALLFTATEDRLHQDYRADAYPQSLATVRSLRERGLPAAISGAGPTVIVFAEVPEVPGFQSRSLTASARGAHQAV